jgi:hypothetical protein
MNVDQTFEAKPLLIDCWVDLSKWEVALMRKSNLIFPIVFILLFLASTAHAQQIKNAVPYVARPLPLSAVRLTGGPLKRAQDLDAEYLLKLEPDRMLAYYRSVNLNQNTGLTGWDRDRRNLTGHIAGHYLSAVTDVRRYG